VVIQQLAGRTDATGRFAFRFALPQTLVGLPQMAEQGSVDLTAEVTDSARQVASKQLSLPVAKSELTLSAFPEAGVLVPGVDNLVYVLTAYPDGQPAKCRLTLNWNSNQTDAQGICTFHFTPTGANETLKMQAEDEAGRKASLAWGPENHGKVPPLLLRTDKAVYAAGQTAQITLLSPEPDNTVFLDVIQDGQTVLTKSVPLANHQAGYALNLPASLVGVLKINAYMITAAGEDRGCTRIIYVSPRSGLHIAARTSKAVYRPGEVARMDFTMTEAQGRPAPGALGLSVVDESVFALSEDRPGLLSQLLAAEGELLKPRYQIKSFANSEQLLLDAESDQALAQAYLSELGRPAQVSPEADQLVTGGYLPQNVIDHARSMRGKRWTPFFGPKNAEFKLGFQVLSGLVFCCFIALR